MQCQALDGTCRARVRAYAHGVRMPGGSRRQRNRRRGDLGLVLSSWGTPNGDVNGDKQTNGADLTLVLAGWGGC
jgi:hypothetical protein